MTDMKKDKHNKNMEFLMKELQKEWEKPKQVHKTLLVERKGMAAKKQVITESVDLYHKLMDGDDISFKEVVKMNRDCYVLLRLATKIVDAYNKHIGEDYVSLALDKEEYTKYRELFPKTDE